MVSMSSCKEWEKMQTEVAAKLEASQQAQKLKAEVISQMEIENGEWNWTAIPLSEAARESAWNKLMENSHMLEAEFTIHNKSQFAAKDFIVSISVRGHSGTIVGTVSTNTLYERLAPGESKTFSRQSVGAIPVGEGTATISVTNLEVIQ